MNLILINQSRDSTHVNQDTTHYLKHIFWRHYLKQKEFYPYSIIIIINIIIWLRLLSVEFRNTFVNLWYVFWRNGRGYYEIFGSFEGGKCLGWLREKTEDHFYGSIPNNKTCKNIAVTFVQSCLCKRTTFWQVT